MARERISVDPHQRSRRRQQPGGGKHFMPAIIGLLMLLVFAGAAGGYIPVARDLLQFVDLLVDDRYVDVAQGLSGNGLDAVVAQRPVHMDKVPAQVRIFFFVHGPICPDEVPGPGVG